MKIKQGGITILICLPLRMFVVSSLNSTNKLLHLNKSAKNNHKI